MNEINDKPSSTAFVEIEVASQPESGKPLLIKGKFNIFYEQDGLTAKGAEILKHIVLVVTRGGNHAADALFKNVIVFDDDITETENGCTGKFNFNLFEKIDFDGAGDYYILCSIGSITSNVILASFES